MNFVCAAVILFAFLFPRAAEAKGGSSVRSDETVVTVPSNAPSSDGAEVAIPPEVAADRTRDELLKENVALQKENLALKNENQRLRRELVRRRVGEPEIDLSRVREKAGAAGEETNGKATDDGGYWLATEKMRRHNSKCKYYKLGRGRPCQKDEGTPCKRCGG